MIGKEYITLLFYSFNYKKTNSQNTANYTPYYSGPHPY